MTKYFNRRYKKVEKLIKDCKIKNREELITFAKKEVIKNYKGHKKNNYNYLVSTYYDLI